jgi:hypothetical protein
MSDQAKAPGTEIKTFIGFEELTNKRFKEQELHAAIAGFSLPDLLQVAVRLDYLITYSLLLPGRSRNTMEVERFLAGSLLSDRLRERLALIARDWPEKRLIFTRQQALTLANMSVAHCDLGKAQQADSDARRDAIGEALLGINEILFSPRQLRGAKSRDRDEQMAALEQQIGYLLALYNPTSLQQGLARMDVMITERLPKAGPETLKRAFERSRGVSLVDYRDLILSLVIYYLSTNPGEVVSNPERLVIDPPVFCAGNKIPPEELKLVLNAESLPLEKLRGAMAENIRGRPAQDFSLWRRWPLLRLDANRFAAVDFGLLIEKFGQGVRWLFVNAFEAGHERAAAFAQFGELAEGYTDWLLRKAGDGGLGGQLVSFPMFPGRENQEAADGLLLVGDHLFALEYRTGSIPAAAVAGEDPSVLLTQVEKLFGDPGGARFADRLEVLFHRDVERRRSIDNIDLAAIRRVTPVFVVFENFWRLPLATVRIANTFAELVLRRDFREGVRVDKALLIDLDLLESLMGPMLAGSLSLGNCLAAKSDQDADQRMGFRDFLRAMYPAAFGKIEWDEEITRVKAIWNSASQKYFGTTVWQ